MGEFNFEKSARSEFAPPRRQKSEHYTMSSKNEAVDLNSLGSPAPEKHPGVPPELLNPASQAYMNATIGAAIREALQGLAPILASSGLTVEKLQLMEDMRRAPSADQAAAAARSKREKQLMIQEANDNAQNIANQQSGCEHRYSSHALAVSAIRNFPDRNPRFICHLCMLVVQPRRWDILAPNEKFPRGEEKIVDAHPLYASIRKEWSLTHEL